MTTSKLVEETDAVVIRFAGDSGDGMHLTGTQFTHSSAISGNDVSTFPDFPAEIRAPQGTLPGVSGFQLQFGGKKILTPGDVPDVLVVMNPAALKVNLAELPSKGMLIVNSGTFGKENLRKAGYKSNPLDDPELAEKYKLVVIDITRMTLDVLEESPLKKSAKQLCKNFFALGLMYWMYDRSMDLTISWLGKKFANKEDVRDANIKVLKAGYYYGETAEVIGMQYKVSRARMEPGIYRKITGNEALSLGLVAATQLSGREMVFGGYPITPASDIIAELSKHKHFGIKTVQAEDEIAGIGIAIGASFVGSIGITATSGPGLCLKAEAMNLALITELPLVVIDVQRGGPSTGLPTKTEQSDLMQNIYGRNGDSPLPVLAAKSPSDCFDVAIEAVRLALIYNTPVILLSDGFIANGAEPWKIPDVSHLESLTVNYAKEGEPYVSYKRDKKTLARTLALPGTPGLEHRIGGLEKDELGAVCYDTDNHQKMCDLRLEKVLRMADTFPPIDILGDESGNLLVLGWGGTYGTITTAVEKLQGQGKSVSSIHLRHLFPFPHDLKDILGRFETILIPELNMGQLIKLIRSEYLVDAIGFNKVEGRPFTVAEMCSKIEELL